MNIIKISSNVIVMFAMVIFTVSCNSDSLFFPSFDSDDLTLAERRLLRTGEPPLTDLRVFPSATVIKELDVVKAKMDEAWDMMLEHCTSAGRYEYGFCIYLNSNGTIYLGEMQHGPFTPNDGSTSTINLVVDRNPDDLCAVFHAHTSYKYMPYYYERTTGPSDCDINAADSFHIPGLVYDYTQSIVEGGENLTDHRVYTYGYYNPRPSYFPH